MYMALRLIPWFNIRKVLFISSSLVQNDVLLNQESWLYSYIMRLSSRGIARFTRILFELQCYLQFELEIDL